MLNIRRKSRGKLLAENNLGIIYKGSSSVTEQEYRCQKLKKINDYYTSDQYNGKAEWANLKDPDAGYFIDDVKPKIIYPFAEILCDRISSKLLSRENYPKLRIEDDPEFEYFANLVEKEMMLKSTVKGALLRFPITGSAFVNFFLEDGNLIVESYNSNYCYPKFESDGDLESVMIQYIYEDDEEKDSSGKYKKKWFKKEISKFADIEYDNPDYEPSKEPVFFEKERNEHGLGYVQGTWYRTGTERNDDSEGKTFLSEALMSFIDEFNKNLSKTADSVQYGTDPQLILEGMLQDEVDDLIKSTYKAWSTGREGKANFLEVSGSGVINANDFRNNSLMKNIMEIARVVILDPEKIVGSAQSAKAMEVLHGPMVDMIRELQPYVEKGIKNLYNKILSTLIIYNLKGAQLSFTMPPQYKPKAMALSFSWPPIFPLTTQDKQQIVSTGVQLSSANILSRETVLRWIISQMPDIPVDDIELEIQKINSQQQFNTFGF